MTVFPLCILCRHCRLPDSITCTAFPDGIPDRIFQEGFNHRNPFPGDHGIQFEPKPEVAAQFAEEKELAKAS